MRDLTKHQFEKRLADRGITNALMGYYNIGGNKFLENRVSVYARNGGDSRRSQLAYLISEQRKFASKVTKTNPL